jgi:hypothetical protein
MPVPEYMSLKHLRVQEYFERPTAEIAERLGTTPRNLFKQERLRDHKLGWLRRYLQALDLDLTVLIVDGGEPVGSLAVPDPAPPRRTKARPSKTKRRAKKK